AAATDATDRGAQYPYRGRRGGKRALRSLPARPATSGLEHWAQRAGRDALGRGRSRSSSHICGRTGRTRTGCHPCHRQRGRGAIATRPNYVNKYLSPLLKDAAREDMLEQHEVNAPVTDTLWLFLNTWDEGHVAPPRLFLEAVLTRLLQGRHAMGK